MYSKQKKTIPKIQQHRVVSCSGFRWERSTRSSDLFIELAILLEALAKLDLDRCDGFTVSSIFFVNSRKTDSTPLFPEPTRISCRIH